MADNSFDEMLDGMAEISEEINARMIEEGRGENEIIQEMESQAFENIRQIIEKEIKKNQKMEFRIKYSYVTKIDEVSNTANHICRERLAMQGGERKIA
jgi:hypothetical protein